MFECITHETYDFFTVSHFILPFYLYILWGGGWDAAFFALALASVWEIFEVLLVELFDSYVFFGEFEPGLESACGISILDIGNAVLGCLLGAIVIDRHSTQIKSKIFSCFFPQKDYLGLEVRKERFCTCTAIVGWIEITLLSIIWSFASSVSWYCVTWFYTCTNKTNPDYFPYGHFICTGLGITISWLYMKRDNAIKSIICTVTTCGLASIKIISSAIMVYISFALLSIVFIIYRYTKTRRPA